MLKNALYLIAFICLIFSCKSKPEKTSSTKKPAVDTSQSIINKFKPILNGVWVKEDYINKAISTRSPIAAANLTVGIATMHLATTAIAEDTLPVQVSWDNHIPGEVTLKFKPGTHSQSLIFGDSELGYAITNTDTTLIFYQKYNKQWVQTRYIKALQQSTGDNLEEGINYLLNKGLVAGSYTLPYAGKATEVTFTNDGLVSGLAHFKKYYIENNFADRKFNNLDQIIFNPFSNDETTYTYSIDKNTLNLFEISKTTDSILIKGKLKYRLLRKATR